MLGEVHLDVGMERRIQAAPVTLHERADERPGCAGTVTSRDRLITVRHVHPMPGRDDTARPGVRQAAVR